MNQVLPDDVLLQILVWLPVKTLLRFRCLSKTWCNLINSPDFIDIHISHAKNHSNSNNRVVLVRRLVKDKKKTLLSFHSYQDGEHGDHVSLCLRGALDLDLPSSDPDFIKVYGACNGIVCIAELPSWMSLDSDSDRIYLCNLATRRYLRLPPSPFGVPGIFFGVSTESLGFGFDPSTKGYKVVKFISYCYEDTRTRPAIGVEIYELRTNSWRRLDVPPPAITCPCPDLNFPVSLFNGSLLHWCASCLYDWWHGILSFNMCTEAFQKMEFPCDSDGFANLAVLDDSLAFILIKDTTSTQLPPSSDRPPISLYEHSIDIWVMMEYGIKESWIKKFSIDPFSFIGGATVISAAPLSSWNNEILLLHSENGHLISCSLQNNYCREIGKYDISDFRDLEVLVYEETLVSLGGIGSSLSWRKL